MPLDLGVAIVVAILVAALLLFVLEPFPTDVIAIGVMVALMVFGQWTGVTPETGVSGLANPATVTVLSMFIISDGVRRTGLVQKIGTYVEGVTGGDERRQLGAAMGLVTPLSGFVSNTATVAVLVPMVEDLARRSGVSPSRLLLPMSYASMMGGMLTLIGTSTSLLASEFSGRMLGRRFSFFEFTHLAVLVIGVGVAYLFLLGPRLVPERVRPDTGAVERFGLRGELWRVEIPEDSRLIGKEVPEAFGDLGIDLDAVRLDREDEVYLEPLSLQRRRVREGDVFVLRAGEEAVKEFVDEGFGALVQSGVLGDEDLSADDGERTLAEVVVSPGSSLRGENLASSKFREKYDSTVLGIKRGGEPVESLMETLLEPGDHLLLMAAPETVKQLGGMPDFVVAGEPEQEEFRRSRIPVALGILLGFVLLAASGTLPVMVAALGSALAMVVSGCIRPSEMYDSVQWSVIFMLAGLIPLGLAMELTGVSEMVAEAVVGLSGSFSAVLVLGAVYLVTAVMANVVSNYASVALMVPVALEVASGIGSNPFSFVLAVTFAASTAFMTPMGSQPNLLVYGPGGYRFSDYLKFGGPLQLLLAVVTTAGIAVLWGV